MRSLPVLIVSVLCAVSLYGDPCSGIEASLTVNETLYTLGMESNSSTCFLTGAFGSFQETGYTVTINASIQPDPVIDFGMNFEGTDGDPSVVLMISTPYTGGPFSTVSITGSGTLTDSGRMDGSASVAPQSGSDIEIVRVNGSTISPQSPINPGCSFTGQVLGFSQLCPSATSAQVNGSFLASGTLEVDAAYILSSADSYNVAGSATLGAVPEPRAAGVLLGSCLLAAIALARRRRLA
jgi:hypothetical protein